VTVWFEVDAHTDWTFNIPVVIIPWLLITELGGHTYGSLIVLKSNVDGASVCSNLHSVNFCLDRTCLSIKTAE